jgi:hypothetical protein
MPVDLAAFADAQIVRFRADIEEQIARLLAAIRTELENAPLGDDGKIVPSRNLELLNQVAGNLVRDYDEMFRTAMTDRWKQVAAGIVQEVSADLQTQGISDSFTRAGADALIAMVDGTLVDIATIGGKGADELRRIVESIRLTPMAPAEILTELQGQLQASLAEVLNLVDTAVMGLDREVVITQAADSGYEWFFYDGPLDGITRAWCDERVGFLFHASEMDEVPNDTGPQPPSRYGGGWRCRHRWVAVHASRIREYPRFEGRSYEMAAAA